MPSPRPLVPRISVPLPFGAGIHRPRARAVAAALALSACALLGSPSLPLVADAGEPDAGAAVPQTPRFAALEQEIRHLERSLQAMRRARTELTAGRPEPVPVDGPARAASDARRLALREVARYEAARAKGLALHADAVAASDDVKASEARAALDAADLAFVAAVQKIDAKAEAKADAKPDAKPDPKPAAKPDAPKEGSGEGRTPGRRGSRRSGSGGDGSGMGSGDDLDDEDDED